MITWLCEGSSLYPNESDDLFGDPILFKVNKRLKHGVAAGMEYEVLGVRCDEFLMDIFHDPHHSAYDSLGTQVAKFVEDVSEASDVCDFAAVSAVADSEESHVSPAIESVVCRVDIQDV